MKDQNEINVLDELSKGACMGMDAIHFIREKIHDKSFKDFLDKQYECYENIRKRICEIYPEYSEKEPHKTNAMNKVMTYYGIEMRTMTDDSDSKLAELLMQGTNMGIIEGRKLLNHKDTDEQTNKIMEEYVAMQEKCVETLKKYL